MKKILFTLFILSLIFLTGCTKDGKTTKNQVENIINRDYIIVGVKTDSKPFGFINKETGEIEGFDIDIAKNIANDILGSDRKIKYEPVTPATKIEAIMSGEVDIVVATMSITPQRQFLVDFSEPYYIAGQSALVREDSDIYNFTDLKNKTTIVVLGSTAEENIRKILPTARLIGFKNYEEAFNAFESGRGDAISTDNTILSGFQMEHPGYRILKNRISQEPYAIGFKRNEEDESLKKNLNFSIRRMQKDGTINELKKKWKC